MSEELETAKRHLNQAKELRAIAAGTASKENRESLLKIAEDYEGRARTMKSIDKTKKAMRVWRIKTNH